ncbi:NmrA family NAD(P)-binding protein [Sphingomonas sp.]|uniref:NmrA family NAD(P)-binding protein n=1 Tax=Sphingomonas sp. TaxID=28214 RepID=UPI000DB30CDA|nr:NmrA family NAD(P)-binding protein [Sphingomonas sp.]PZU05810.1 MAG: epimerase [Sphingomonas sp.]
MNSNNYLHPRHVLVVGATGKFAGHVVPALAQRGVSVRALIRHETDENAVRRAGAVEVAVGDLTQPRTIADALRAVDAVFYIAPAFIPREAEIGSRFVEATIESGVRRIVFSSVIHPVIGSLVNHAAKAPVEEAILNSDLEYTILHPALYFQNFQRGWDEVIETGVLAEPWACETRFSRVDYRDVADVAAIALTEDRLLYGTFELCAEGWLNRYDVAALIGEVLGQDISVSRTDPAALGRDADPMRPMFAHYDHAGLKGNALTLLAILGREPRNLRAFFEELKQRKVPET